MSNYTNNTGISLSMAVWLANDLYDHSGNNKQISVTTLIKPLKQTILKARVPAEEATIDLANLVKAQSGTAVHTAVEEAWLHGNYKKPMKLLNYPDKIIDNIVINPTKGELTPDAIPIYMEKRSEKEIDDITVSGKFDIVIDGELEDIKNTSTYTYIKKSNDQAYKLQGSLYKWLNEDIITGDFITIQYIFTDWTAMGAMRDKNYPPNAQMAYKVPLMTVQETDNYVRGKIFQLNSLWDSDESAMPACTAEELWQEAPVWKYYKNPAKLARSTKNFTNAYEANTRLAQDGGTGVVIEVPGQVKACKYCDAFPVCKQKDTYILNGSLKV